MRIGIDLGGTKIEALALADTGIEQGRIRIDTPSNNYSELLTCLKELIDTVESTHGRARSIGFGTPGSIAPGTGHMQNSNSTVLNGRELQKDLEQTLGRQVKIANDADCFTLSEATDGAAARFNTVFGVILGTGVGGGLCVNKQLISGPNALTGEWGHNPLTVENVEARTCYCGRRGCIESWISGPAITEDHFLQTRERLTAAEIANSESKTANATIERFIDRLAQALGQVINIADPECIVFGGGLSNIPKIYDELPDRIGPFIMTDVCHTHFVKAQHGDSSGVRGAAWLWP